SHIIPRKLGRAVESRGFLLWGQHAELAPSDQQTLSADALALGRAGSAHHSRTPRPGHNGNARSQEGVREYGVFKCRPRILLRRASELQRQCGTAVLGYGAIVFEYTDGMTVHAGLSRRAAKECSHG